MRLVPLFSVLCTIAPLANAQVLVGSSTTVGGVSTLVTVDPVTGATQPFMTVPIPAGFELYNLSILSDCRIAGTVYRGDTANNRSRLMRMNPALGTSSMVEFAAPLDTSYAEGFDWSPRHNAFLISFAALGNFGTTRLALVDENGAVLQTSGAMALGDMDTVASSPTLDIFFDLNRTSSPRVNQLATLFPSPSVSAFATPPTMAGWHDAAIHPATGQIFFSNEPGTRILQLVGNTYVNGPVVQGGIALRGLAFVNLPPLIPSGPADAIVCPTGQATFAPPIVGNVPMTIIWQREVTPNSGNFIALNDGSTVSWDGNAPGIGAIVSGSATPSLTIQADTANGRVLGPAHAIRYRVVLSISCGGLTSTPAQLTICPADINCDNTLDFFDYLDFVAAFADNQPTADFNQDLVIDFFDYLDFVQVFSTGC